jgi:AhpD family alkylhydroperoxidase
MRRSAAVVIAVAWGVGVGGTFGCLLPWLLGYWHLQRPLPYWIVAQAAGVVLIGIGLVPIVQAFVEFVKAGGTPVPVASPPRLVVSGFYRYVRNPIYVGFLVILIGQALLFGSMGLVVYTVVAWCVGAAAVRFYEQPRLARRFGAEYQPYLQAVPAWIPRLRPWTPPQEGGATMARITGVSPAQARLRTRIVYWFVGRGMAKLTGNDAERVLGPLQMYAHVPALFTGYVKLEQATAKLHDLDPRLHALAELKAATLTQCEYCIDLGSAIAHRWGLTDAELLALPGYRSSPLFSELDKLVLDYAVGMSRTPVDVPDALFDQLRQHLSEPQIVELTHHIALENMRGRFNLALGIGSSGLSEGMVCALPVTHPTESVASAANTTAAPDAE